jgi:hypothetical protein
LRVVNFQQGGISGAATSATTGTFNSTSGNTLVVGVRATLGSFGGAVVKNAAGVALTAIPGSVASGGSSDVSGLWYLPNITGQSGDSVTISGITSNPFLAICVWEIAGASQTSPLDTSASGESASSTTPTSGQFSTANANEIIIAFAGEYYGGAVWNPQNGYVPDSIAVGGGPTAAAQHWVVSSTQTNITTSMIAVNAAQTSIAVATFIAAASGGGGQGNQPLGCVIIDLDSGGFPIAELQTGTDA